MLGRAGAGLLPGGGEADSLADLDEVRPFGHIWMIYVSWSDRSNMPWSDTSDDFEEFLPNIFIL